MADSPHRCPADCGRPVPWKQFACPADWVRLPPALQVDVARTWKDRQNNPIAHRAAMLRTINWFRAHPVRTGARS